MSLLKFEDTCSVIFSRGGLELGLRMEHDNGYHVRVGIFTGLPGMTRAKNGNVTMRREEWLAMRAASQAPIEWEEEPRG